jgi:hypothetical protein
MLMQMAALNWSSGAGPHRWILFRCRTAAGMLMFGEMIRDHGALNPQY